MRARVIFAPHVQALARAAIVACGFALAALLLAPRAHAAWPGSPTVNLPVCTAPGVQSFRVAAPDGFSGLLVAWVDTRGDSADIYVQRVGAGGEVLWEWNGVHACAAPRDQDQPAIVGDGQGGAFVAWRDFRAGQTGDVYAQHFGALGQPLWAANGIGVCTVTGEQANPVLVADGVGGVIVVWEDSRAVPAIYAQRLLSDGTRRWAAGGVRLAPWVTVPQFEASAASDGALGVIVAWTQNTASGLDVAAQHVDDAGDLMWGNPGLALCGSAGNQFHARVAADGQGGAVFAWEDHRTGVGQVHAQRSDHWGNLGWGANGVAVAPTTDEQFDPALASGGPGAAVLAWHDQRGATSDIWAQRINSIGGRAWGATGFPVCLAPGDQQFASVTADGSGGALIVWEDGRAGSDVWAQRVSGAGAGRWPQDGAPVSTAPGSQYQPVVVSETDSIGVVVWVDQRSGGSDLYAQRIPAVITLDAPSHERAAVSLSVSPHPARARGAVRFTLASAGEARLELFDAAGRRVRVLADGPLAAGAHERRWDGRDDAGRAVRPGLYLVRLGTREGARTARWAWLGP